MKKNLISIILVLMLGLSLFAFAACGTCDCTDVTGIPGPQGPQGEAGQDGQVGSDGQTPHIGTNGNWWIGTTDTGVFAGVQADRVYTLGQTFTYVTQTGLRLFSIKVEADTNAYGGFVFYVTNHNMPSLAPSAFISLRRQLGGGGFATSTLPAPGNTILTMGNTARIAFGTGFEGAYVFFGWPTTNELAPMIPYARFRVR